MLRGFISIPRYVFQGEDWEARPFDTGKALADLWSLASITDGHIKTRRNVRVPVKRGQVAWSIKSLAHRWGKSTTWVKRALKQFTEDSHIILHMNNVTTLITIIDYDLTSMKVSQTKPQKSRKSPAKVPQSVPLVVRLKESKEGNEAEGPPQPPPIETMNVTTPELALLRLVPGYPYDATLDLEMLSTLALEFPEVDIPELLKSWTLYITDRKKQKGVAFKANASPRSQLRNQFKMAKDKGMHKRKNGNGSGSPAHEDDIDYEKYVEPQEEAHDSPGA